MAPKEAYLSIKAHKAREDAFYGHLSLFVSVLANVAGSGPKKAIKPSELYQPQLTYRPKLLDAPEENDAWKEAARKLMEQASFAKQDEEEVISDT